MYNPPVFYLILICGFAVCLLRVEVTLQLHVKSIVNIKNYQLIKISSYLIFILIFLYVFILSFYKKLW